MRSFALLFLLVALVACDRKSERQVIAYEVSEYPDAPKPSLSSVPLPIFVGFEELEEVIKNKLPVVLVNIPNVKKGSLEGASIRILRKSEVILSEKNGELTVNLKLKIEIKPVITRQVLGRDVSVSPKIVAVVDVDLLTPIDFDTKYHIITKFKIRDIRYIEEPEAHILFFNFPVKNAVDSILNAQSDVIGTTIDKVVKKYVNLRKPLERIWAKLYRPIRINRKISEIYIQSSPQALALSSVVVTPEGIWAQTRLSAYLETRIENDTLPRNVVPLPDLTKLDSIDNTFDMRFLVVIPLARVNDILNSSHVKKPLSKELNLVTIDQLKLQTSPKGLLLYADISSPTRAGLYFEGKLSFFAPDTALIASDIAFQVDDGGMLVAAADAILHEAVMQAIGSELQLPLGSLINNLEPLVEQAIDNGKIGKSISVDLSEVTLEPKEIGYRPDSIIVEIQARGVAALQILQFKKREQ